LIDQLRTQFGVDVEPLVRICTLKHGVTRFRITLDCYRALHVAGRPSRGIEVAWLRPEELVDYPLSVTGRKLARLLSKGHADGEETQGHRDTEKTDGSGKKKTKNGQRGIRLSKGRRVSPKKIHNVTSRR
jgi:hypothetical protein